MSVQRLDELLKKLGRLEDVPDGVLRASVAREIQEVAGAARLGCPVNYGELRNSIHARTEAVEGGVRGSCYTTKGYAPYVEFGTGPKGAESHEGISPSVSPAYVQAPWWIHESQIDRRDAEKYGWFYIDTEDGRFYRCSGQAAQPFLYPALKNREETIVRNIGADIQKGVRKV